MSKVFSVAMVVCTMMLVGCASVPMTSASLDREAKTFVPEAGKANIYVVRCGGIGTAVVVQNQLDGRVAGSLAPNTYQMMSVAPGEHVLSTGPGAENVEQVKINAEAGKNYFYKASIAMGWALPRVHLKPMEEQKGRKTVTRLKRAEAMTY